MSSRATPPRVRPLALLLAALVLIIAGCVRDDGGLTLPDRPAQLVTPLLVGLTDAQRDAYTSWFRGDPLAGPAKVIDADGSASFLEPNCPLGYDHEVMANGSLGPVGFPVSDEWHNPARQEVLVWLRGVRHDPTAVRAISCTEARDVLWLPVRLQLASGIWTIDGWTSPGTHISIEFDLPWRMVGMAGVAQPDWSGAKRIVDPFRLSRFRVTSDNVVRVARFATAYSGIKLPRRLHWFRLSDLAEPYAEAGAYPPAAGAVPPGDACTAPIVAFWGKHDQDRPIACGGKWADQALLWDNGLFNSAYLDPLARQSGKRDGLGGDGNQYDVFGVENDDKTCMPGLAGGSTCYGNVAPRWGDVRHLVRYLAQTAMEPSARGRPGYWEVRQQRLKVMAELGAWLRAQNADSLSSPEGFGSFGSGADGANATIDDDAFPVLVANGEIAFNHIREPFDKNPVYRGYLAGFIGEAGVLSVNDAHDIGRSGTRTSVVIEPSLVIDEFALDADGDGEANDWFDRNSLLFGANGDCFSGAERCVRVMPFSSSNVSAEQARCADDAASCDSATARGLLYEQGPIGRFTLTVSSAVSGATITRYETDYLPLFAIGRNGQGTSIRESDDLFADPAGTIGRFINNWVYGVYRDTIGSWMSALSEMTTTNLLAVPNLEPAKIAYFTANGPVYAVHDQVAGASYLSADPEEQRAARMPSFVRACLSYMVQHGGLPRDPSGLMDTALGNSNHTLGECYQQNDLYRLWSAVRALMFVLILVLVGNYYISWLMGRLVMPFGGFVARLVFVIVLALGMEMIVGVLMALVSDVILVTNYFGSQLSGGQAYSHLWLFNSYLASPSRDVSVFALIMLAPFSIIGLLVLLLVNWFRLFSLIVLLILSPLWIVSILADLRMRFFLRSLQKVLALYIAPAVSLVMLLLMFVLFKALGLDVNPGGHLVGAFFGMIAMLALAAFSIGIARLIVTPIASRGIAALDAAFTASENASLNTTMDALGQGVSAEVAAERRRDYIGARERHLGGGAPAAATELGAGDTSVAPGSESPAAPALGPGPAGASAAGSTDASAAHASFGEPAGTMGGPSVQLRGDTGGAWDQSATPAETGTDAGSAAAISETLPARPIKRSFAALDRLPGRLGTRARWARRSISRRVDGDGVRTLAVGGARAAADALDRVGEAGDAAKRAPGRATRAAWSATLGRLSDSRLVGRPVRATAYLAGQLGGGLAIGGAVGSHLVASSASWTVRHGAGDALVSLGALRAGGEKVRTFRHAVGEQGVMAGLRDAYGNVAFGALGDGGWADPDGRGARAEQASRERYEAWRTRRAEMQQAGQRASRRFRRARVDGQRVPMGVAGSLAEWASAQTEAAEQRRQAEAAKVARWRRLVDSRQQQASQLNTSSDTSRRRSAAALEARRAQAAELRDQGLDSAAIGGEIARREGRARSYSAKTVHGWLSAGHAAHEIIEPPPPGDL